MAGLGGLGSCSAVSVWRTQCIEVFGIRVVEVPISCPSRMNRTADGVHSRTAVCHVEKTPGAQNRSLSVPEDPRLNLNPQIAESSRTPDGKSISPSAGQFWLSGQSSQVIWYPG